MPCPAENSEREQRAPAVVAERLKAVCFGKHPVRPSATRLRG